MSITYHSPTRKILLSLEEMELAAGCFRNALRNIRKGAGLPLDRYKRPGPMTPADHAQQSILEGAKTLGIDLGGDWGSDLDLREPDEISPLQK